VRTTRDAGEGKVGVGGGKKLQKIEDHCFSRKKGGRSEERVDIKILSRGSTGGGETVWGERKPGRGRHPENCAFGNEEDYRIKKKLNTSRRISKKGV